MGSNLTAALSNRFKQKVISAKVLDVLGKKVTVRLSGDGTKLTGITFTGPVPVVGQEVLIDYRNANNPTAISTSDNPPVVSIIKLLDCTLPEMPPPPMPTFPPFPPLPPLPPFPIIPIPPMPNLVCLDDSPANGPVALTWDHSAIGGDTGYSSAIAWYPCIIRKSTATYPSRIDFYVSFIGTTAPTFQMYAIDTTKARLITGVITVTPGTTYTVSPPTGDAITYTTSTVIHVAFNPGAATVIAGFELALNVGYENIAPLTLTQADGKWSSGGSIARTIYDPSHGHIQFHITQTLAMSGSYGNRPFAGISFDFDPQAAWGTLYAYVDVTAQCDTGNWNIEALRLRGWDYATWDWVAVNAQSFSYKGLFTVPRQIGTPYGWGPREAANASRILQVEPVGFPYWNPPTATFSGDMTVDFYWTTAVPVAAGARINLVTPNLFNVCPATV